MIWVFLVLGIMLVACSFGYLFLGWHSVRWPTTQGRILFSKLRKRKANSTTVHEPRLIYEYVVNGASRRSGNIGFFAAMEGKRWAELLLAERPEGAEVLVYYHPRFPRLAVLEPGMKQVWVWVMLAVIGGLVVLSSGVVLFGDNPNALIDFLFGLVSKIAE